MFAYHEKKGAQPWTSTVLSKLPASVRTLNSDPEIVAMNDEHSRRRVAAGRWYKPVNSMVYDTLKRLQKRGVVKRCEKGVYKLIDWR